MEMDKQISCMYCVLLQVTFKRTVMSETLEDGGAQSKKSNKNYDRWIKTFV